MPTIWNGVRRVASTYKVPLAVVALCVALPWGCSAVGPPSEGRLGVTTAAGTLGPFNVLTRSYDNNRSSANISEVLLTPTSVAKPKFGLLSRLTVDDAVYAQVLYASGVQTSSGLRNLVYVATVHNSVYAFDAEVGGAPVWGPTNLSGTGMPATDNDIHCVDFQGARLAGNSFANIGILSTPVIDAASGTMYVVAHTNEAGKLVYRLRTLDISTGQERSNSGVQIKASVAVDGGAGGAVSLDPQFANQRTGLALSNGTVYFGFGSYCDNSPYHGWLLAYNATTLTQVGVYNTTPNDDGHNGGGIWQSAQAPAIDSSGNVYVASGNGRFDGQTAFGDSVLELAPRTLQRLGSFTPSDLNTHHVDGSDLDLGVAGPILFPAPSNRLLQGSKTGKVYQLLQGNLGQGHFQGVWDGNFIQAANTTAEMYAASVLWNGPQGFSVFVFASNEKLVRGYHYDGTRTPPGFSSPDLLTSDPNDMGGFISLSANASTTGIVWATTPNGPSPPVPIRPLTLHALKASDLSQIWSSDVRSRDKLTSVATFNPPVVANGRVYVPSFTGAVSVFGIKRDNDINGDGRADVVLTGPNNWSSIPVAMSVGNGSFAITNKPLSDFPALAFQATQGVLGDFNGDGKADLALTGGTGWQSIPVALSNGDGSFTFSNVQNTQFASLGATPGARLISGDFDGDGLADLALVGASSWNFVAVALSGGDGSFSGVLQNDFGATPNFATFAAESGVTPLPIDFDGDGLTDIALTGHNGWTTIPVALSFGGGTFGPSKMFNSTVGSFPSLAAVSGAQAVVGDFDGDGRDDIALTGGAGWNTIPTAFSEGTNGNFTFYNAPTVAASPAFGTSTAQTGAKVVAGDFDNDGRTDIAVTGGFASPGVPWTMIPVAFSRLSTSHNGGSFSPTNMPLPTNGPPFSSFATEPDATALDVIGH